MQENKNKEKSIKKTNPKDYTKTKDCDEANKKEY